MKISELQSVLNRLKSAEGDIDVRIQKNENFSHPDVAVRILPNSQTKVVVLNS